MTKQLDILGFKELFVMHIPRATLPLTPPTLKTFEMSSEGVLTGEDVMVIEGSITSLSLVVSCPETNLTPL